MQITFDTANADEVAQVRSFLGLLSGTPVAAEEPVADEPAPVAKKAPAKKAASAAKKAAPKPEPTPEPEEAEEAPEEDDEDLLGTEEPTMADAVALATQLVSGGDAAKVKAALADAGVKRVSELSGDAIGDFVRALS